MKTIREEVRFDMGPIPGGPTEGLLDQFECLAWAKFDELKRDGQLKIFGVVDASAVVERALRKILGSRPVSCA